MHLIRLLIIFLWLLPSPLQAADKLFLLGDSCVRCHLLCETRARENSVIAWREGVHFRPDTGCSDCHGGDRFLYMDFKPGHMGIPDRSQTIGICEKCHEQQVFDFVQRSRPEKGKVLCAATCVTCHGYHRVPPAKNSILSERTCNKCHSFELARSLLSALKAAEARMSAVEERIAQYEKNGSPVLSYKADQAIINTEFSRSIHRLPLSRVEGWTKEKTMTSLIALEKRMERSPPAKWQMQGMFVLVFLAIVLVLLALYLRSVNKKEKKDDGKERGQQWVEGA